jgi:hypothetical protein
MNSTQFVGRLEFSARLTSTRLSKVFDLFAEDNRLNVYAGKLEVRPPGAPTTGGLGHLSWRASPSQTLGTWGGASATWVEAFDTPSVHPGSRRNDDDSI